MEFETNLYSQAHEALLLLQRRMRQVRQTTFLPLDPISAIIVSLLAKNSLLKASEIAKFINLPTSKISNLFKSLVQTGLLRVSIGTSDKRSKVYSFTDKGIALLQSLDIANSKIAQAGLSPLTDSSRTQMAKVMSALGSGLGAPPEIPRENEYFFVPEQRRLVRVTGMLGRRYMNSQFDLCSYQILLEIKLSAKRPRFNEICAKIPFHPSRISRSIDSLARKGIITKIQAKEDKRGLFIDFTPKGLNVFATLHNQIAEIYSKALQEIDIDLIKSFIKSVEIVYFHGLSDTEQLQQKVIKAKNPSEYKLARATLVEILVANGKHTNLSEELLPMNSFVTIRKEGNRTTGVCELRKKTNSWVVSLVETTAGSDSDSFLAKSISILKENYPTASVRL